MIEASAAFDAAIRTASRTFTAVLFDRGTEISAAIRRLSVYKGSCGAADFAPGAVFSSYIEVTMERCDDVLEGKELELKIGVKIGGSLGSPLFEYIRIGFFKVGKPRTTTHQTTFTAYGRIQSMLGDKPFRFTSITGMPSIANVLARIQDLTGTYVEAEGGIDTSVHLNGIFLAKSMSGALSCREALAAAAFAAGGYATETADARIIIRKYSADVTAQFAAAETMADPPVFHDLDTVITGVQVQVSETEIYTSGSEVNLETENAYCSAEAFEEFAENLIGLRYRGGMAEISLGDPRLEPWDTLEIIDSEGSSFIIPCMGLTFIYDGGIQTVCEAPSIETERSISMLEKALTEAQRAADTALDIQARAEAGEFNAVVLRIDSTRGILFKNNWYDTQLRVTLIKGSKIITDLQTLRQEFGAGAYLQWGFRKQADQEWSALSVSDSRITEGGFCLTVTPDDVDEQITFQCDLEA